MEKTIRRRVRRDIIFIKKTGIFGYIENHIVTCCILRIAETEGADQDESNHIHYRRTDIPFHRSAIDFRRRFNGWYILFPLHAF